MALVRQNQKLYQGTSKILSMALMDHRGGNSLGEAGRKMSTSNMSPASLPDLPYDYNALAPVIIPEIMELHHKKHHQAYITNLNAALEKQAEADHKGDLETVIGLQSAIKFNGGGHINHSMFWKMMCPPQEYEPPTGPLAEAIKRDFGSLETMQNKFNAATAAVQGSGWGWLAYNPGLDKIVLATTANQDTLKSTTGLIPLVGVDVWEHAYYLQYKNVRPDYLKEIWKVINWKEAGSRYLAAGGK